MRSQQAKKDSVRNPFDGAKSSNSRHARMLILAAAALAVVLLINWAAGALPILDTTDQRLVTPTREAVEALAGIGEPVTIYLVASEGMEDAYLVALLQRLAGASAKLSLERVLPTDTRVAAYSAAALADNSVVVASETRFVALDQNHLNEYDTGYDYYSNSYVYTDVRMAAEDRVVRAVHYVLSDLPKAYVLIGHGEAELSLSFRAAMMNAQVAVEALNLETAGAVPEDAAVLMVYAPKSDLRAGESESLLQYLQAGGAVLVATDCTVGALPRLAAVLQDYGLDFEPGLVLEGEGKRYVQTYKQYLLPILGEHGSIQKAAAQALSVTVPMAHSIALLPEPCSNLQITPLLTTGEAAYRKPDVQRIATLDLENSDIPGPFNLAVIVEGPAESGTSRLVWIASGEFLSDSAMQASGNANAAFIGELLGTLHPLPAAGPSYGIRSLMLMPLRTSQGLRIAMATVWMGLPSILLLIGFSKALKRRKAI